MNTAIRLAAALALAVCGLAFAVAPRACSGGLGLYVWAGIGAAGCAGAAAVACARELPAWRRAGLALALMCALVLAWVAGLVATDMRIMCRLF